MSENKNNKMKKKYENKKIVGMNYKYFIDHAEEIINDTEHMLGPWYLPFGGAYSEDEKKYPRLTYYIRKFWENHMGLLYEWGGYARVLDDESYVKLGHDTNRKYCEDTGRWDLFIWE